nr:pX=orf6 from 3' terminal nontranslated region [artichoke mottled crinkle tombusvirus AMCV, Peptide, 68 aa] [Artichoke mottled crinkle virus]
MTSWSGSARVWSPGDGDMERVSCAVSQSKDVLATWAYNQISHSNTSQHELDSCLRKLGVTCGDRVRHG